MDYTLRNIGRPDILIPGTRHFCHLEMMEQFGKELATPWALRASGVESQEW